MIELGLFYLILGLSFLLVQVFFWIRDLVRGVKPVNGTVLGENPDTHDIAIRYHTKGSASYEVTVPRHSLFFLLGAPDAGVRLVLKVRKDDPQEVVSVHLTLRSKLTSFSKDGLYSNNYTWKVPCMMLSFSAFFSAIGIVFLTGIL